MPGPAPQRPLLQQGRPFRGARAAAPAAAGRVRAEEVHGLTGGRGEDRAVAGGLFHTVTVAAAGEETEAAPAGLPLPPHAARQIAAAHAEMSQPSATLRRRGRVASARVRVRRQVIFRGRRNGGREATEGPVGLTSS